MRAAALAVAALACTSAKDVAKKQEALIEGVAGRLLAISGDVDKRPPLAEDVLEPGAPTLVFQPSDPGFNAGVVYAVRLKDPCKGEELHWLEEGRQPSHETEILAPPLESADWWLITPVCVLRTGKGRFESELPPKETLADGLRDMAKIQYVMVPRLKFLRPTYDIDPDGKVRTFHPGAILGDALFYELASGKYLGGITIAATNADEVEDEASAYEALQSDLIEHARRGVQDKLQKLAPAWKGPN